MTACCGNPDRPVWAGLAGDTLLQGGGSVEIAKCLRAGTRVPRLAIRPVIKLYDVPEVTGTWSLFTLVKGWGTSPISTLLDDAWEGACAHCISPVGIGHPSPAHSFSWQHSYQGTSLASPVSSHDSHQPSSTVHSLTSLFLDLHISR